MLIQRLSRSQAASGCLRCLANSSSASLLSRQRRTLYSVPPLNNNTEILENGVPGLFSADGVNLAWTQYQGKMVEYLNVHTAGTPDENKTPRDLLIASARDPAKAALFNHASMAFNNHFFFDGLSSEATFIPSDLAAGLERDFSSLETFRDEILATADAMFGPGFVWLVYTRPFAQQPRYKLLTTYLAGSPLSGAHWRQQPKDLNTENASSLGGLSAADMARNQQNSLAGRRLDGPTQNPVGSMGPHSRVGMKQQTITPGGIDVAPILCVNTWEHCYLMDFGVLKKWEYLNAWWDRINWSVAGQRNSAANERRL